jgi:DNA-directed RNA polymerase beta subunit
MFEDICWDILDTCFQKGGSQEASNPLVKHQIDSYNKFADNTLGQIIAGFNPIKVKIANPKNDSVADNVYNIFINIQQPSLTKPYYQLQDGTQTIMTPYIARMNNLTYSSSLYVNVHIVIEVVNKDGMIEKFDKTVNGVYIGKIPIMVHSKLCVLNQMQGIGEQDNNECIYDFGGYFIVNGNEKVLISQDRINENKTLVFHPNNNSEGLYAEIRSMCDSSYLPPKTTSLNMSGKLNHMGRIIRMNTSFLRTEIPVFVVFRALGITSDKEIIQHIVYDQENPDNQRIINELMACCEDACDIKTQEDAENTLIKIMIGANKYNDNRVLLHNNLLNDFLPHVGKSLRRKALYLGYIIRKMIRIYLGYDTYDNRDSYINKRVDTPGVLMSNLFRQCYGKMTKELKVNIEKELNLWRGNVSVPTSDIITDINIHRFFKQSLLESWIKYSLSTGNWGIKSIGSFQNIRQGVSQVLNRMSYASTLSHLRRINTAMEKNGKLVQPRKLDNSQIGMICPAETPEGSSVGLVKNMALSTHISIAMNSTHVRRILVELGVVVYDDSYSYSSNSDNNSQLMSSTAFLKQMGNQDNVYIMVNGDIMGYFDKPDELYRKLKHYKRSGVIHPMTSIIWNIQKSYIAISTEAGRMYRPLYIVDIDPATQKRELRISRVLKRKNMNWKEYSKDKDFGYFVVPNEMPNKSNNIHDPDAYLDEEGFIEYMDCDEVNHAMIATFPSDLEKGIKGTACPPYYTHCEIHPSLMNGILGVNIPFSDHNQSPRNCYQCINQLETVYMSDGTFKRIRDVNVGDKVICFNPNTMESEHTEVVNHYNRITPKMVYNVLTVSGRNLIATYDHKFMTSQSWMISNDFVPLETKLGIYMKSNLYDVCRDIEKDIQHTTDIVQFDNNVSSIYKEIGLVPLHSDNSCMNIIARIAGYYYANEANFKNKKDSQDFNKDVKFIGFGVYGMYDTNFIIYMRYLLKDISWIEKCSLISKLEFASAYLSGKFANLADMQGKLVDELPELICKILKENGIKELPHTNDWAAINLYFKKLGCRYNSVLLQELAVRNEYHMYLEYSQRVGLKDIEYSFEKWQETVEVNGDILFVPFHERFKNRNQNISDITVKSNSHSFIGGNSFAISNCAMGKQALGIYASNFNKRIDTMGNILNYPQKSLVYTKLSKYTMAHKLPSGVNAIVAIMTHTGFNQEDSIMVNQSALDRGLFTSTYYKAMRDVCNKNHSTGEEEIFVNPSNMASLKPYSYNKLNDNGFVSKNTYVSGNDIIVGKVMPKKVNGVITYQDNSMSMKTNDDGYVDMNYSGINSEGYKFCKIRVRKNRKPEIGDKCASCSAQKGTIGMTYRHQDMPFTKDGVVPDIIMNPHAIPSRMTMAQLMECIMGKAGCHIGAFGDATPYNDCSVESIAKVLEMSGMERYGNEILYNGRTGEQIQTEIFIGPTYYQRLKHMVSDKIHCSDQYHEVLTAEGWKFIPEVTLNDKVAILKDGKLVYEHPLEIHHYPDYKGNMYRVKNQAVSLNVTANHRMYIKTCHTRQRVWSDYRLEKAEDIMGKHVKYKRNAEWDAIDYQFVLPAIPSNEEKVFDMDAWITFFGIWMAEGWAHNGQTHSYNIGVCVHKQRVKDVLYDAVSKMGYKFTINNNNNMSIYDKQLHAYMAPLSVGAPNKRLPEWVWELSQEQARKLIHAMELGDGCFKKNGGTFYYTSSTGLADDFMRLCLHAGWSGMKSCHIKAGSNQVKIRGKDVCNNYDIWRISVITAKNEPSVNHGHHKKQNIQEEEMYYYEGPVYCLSVSTEVFMVRRDGKPVWTGNSRGSNGPIVMLTRQPSEGRARSGGLRLGEMERDCFLSHGTANFLAERMLHVSDNYRVFICKKCGLHANVNTDKNIYNCKYCKNNTDITQVRMPYAFKLLNQELYTMNVMMRYICN